MGEKSTKELEHALGNTHINQFGDFVKKNKDSLLNDSNEFCVYIKELLKQCGRTQQNIFIRADIPERYGYKLLSGEKKTKQRDIILRICYAAELTLSQTQTALEKYGLPRLYAKNPRDAFMMIIFNERPGDILEVNSLLKSNGFDPLRTSGLQD